MEMNAFVGWVNENTMAFPLLPSGMGTAEGSQPRVPQFPKASPGQRGPGPTTLRDAGMLPAPPPASPHLQAPDAPPCI